MAGALIIWTFCLLFTCSLGLADFEEEMKLCKQLNTQNLLVWAQLKSLLRNHTDYSSKTFTWLYNASAPVVFNLSSLTLYPSEIQDLPFIPLFTFFNPKVNFFNDPLPNMWYFDLSWNLDKYSYLDPTKATSLLVLWAEALKNILEYLQGQVEFASKVAILLGKFEQHYGVLPGETVFLIPRDPQNQLDFTYILFANSTTTDTVSTLISSIDLFYTLEYNGTAY